MRVFEALACGSLLLTNDLRENGQEELFHDGIHLTTYRDAEDLLNKAAFYFKDINGRTIDSFAVVSNVEVPIISTLLPAVAQASGAAFTLNVSGENFVGGSVVRWNGEDRPTTFTSPSQIMAAISAADIAGPGTALVTVFNPNGGATSNVRSFSIGPAAPGLLTEDKSDRAIALDSVTMVRDPFALLTGNNFSLDGRRRLMLFATNLNLLPGETVSAVTAQAENSQHRIYSLPVEFVGKVPPYDWLTQVVVLLPDELANDVWVSINLRGVLSNKALISIKS